MWQLLTRNAGGLAAHKTARACLSGEFGIDFLQRAKDKEEGPPYIHLFPLFGVKCSVKEYTSRSMGTE
jgi:hypothetical protein